MCVGHRVLGGLNCLIQLKHLFPMFSNISPRITGFFGFQNFRHGLNYVMGFPESPGCTHHIVGRDVLLNYKNQIP